MSSQISRKQRNILDKATRYEELKTTIKTLTTEMEKIKTDLKEIVTKEGTIIEGNQIIKIDLSDTESLIVKNEIRKTAGLKDDALAKIRTLVTDKKYLDKVIRTEEYVDKDQLTELISNGVISKRQANSLISITESKALKIINLDTSEKKKPSKKLR